MERQRLQFIDIIKGGAIILVVLAHLIQTNVEDGIHNRVFQIINSFHMPLFFFASGFIAYKVCNLTEWGGVKRFFLNKLRSLILPLVVWTLFVNNYFLSCGWKAITWNDMVQCLLHPGLWFLMTLFQLSMIFAILHLLSRLKNKWYVDLAMALVVLGTLVAFKQMSLALYFIFYTMGVFVSKYSWLERLWRHPALIAVATVVFFVLTTHWEIGGTVVDDALKIVIASCSFVLAYFFSQCGEHTFIGNKLAYIGKNSLAIYIIHWNFLLFLKEFQIDLEGFNQFWLFLLALAVAVVISYVVIAIAKAIECNKYLAFLMLGKRL